MAPAMADLSPSMSAATKTTVPYTTLKRCNTYLIGSRATTQTGARMYNVLGCSAQMQSNTTLARSSSIKVSEAAQLAVLSVLAAK